MALKLLENRDRFLGIAHDGAFRELDLEIARLQAGVIERAANAVDQPAVAELRCRQIHRHPQRRHARRSCHARACRHASRITQLADGADQAAFFRQRNEFGR